MFAGGPDMRVECAAGTDDGTTAWTGWRWSGTHPDGSRFAMNSVIVFGPADGRIAWTRLYVESVEQHGAGIDERVQELARPSYRAPSRRRPAGAPSNRRSRTATPCGVARDYIA